MKKLIWREWENGSGTVGLEFDSTTIRERNGYRPLLLELSRCIHVSTHGRMGFSTCWCLEQRT